MRKIFTLLSILLGLNGFVYAQPPTRILFIGNSFTGANDLQGIVHQFFTVSGLPVHTEAYAPGGISVGDVSMGTFAHMNNPLVFEMIRSQEWDYIVLQDNQGRFSLDSARFPNPAASKVVEGHLKIRDSLHFYHPCAKMIWFSGWGFKDIDVEMIDSITTNYRVLNDSAKDVIAPIGPAWKRVILTRPGLELWSPDRAHPDVTGSYLTAAVIFGTISGRDVSLSPFNHSIAPPDAMFLKDAAQQTLTDPVIRVKSNVEGTVTPALNWTDPRLMSVPGYTEYRWYLGNKLQAKTTAEYWTPSRSGTYRVWAKDPKGFWHKSCSQEVTVTVSVPEDRAGNTSIKLYPNPATDQLHITNNNSAVTALAVYSLLGQPVLRISCGAGDQTVSVAELPAGQYLVRPLDAGGVVAGAPIRFVKQ